MNILHLTVGHSAFDDRIFYKEATSLAGKHDILILAYSAAGVLKTMGNERREPGEYDRIRIDSFGKCSFPVRVLRRLGAIRFPIGDVIRALARHGFRPDVVHCHEMPSLMLAVALKRHFGARIVFDVHEFFFGYCFDRHDSELLADLSFARLRRRYRDLLRQVDVTINVNEFVRAINVVFSPTARHLLVPNAFVLPGVAAIGERTDKYVLVHEGTLNFGRGLRDLLGMFDDEWIRSNCRLKIVGELRGKELRYFEALSRQKPYLREAVSITGWIDYTALHTHLNGDIGLITMAPRVNNLLAGAPNKLFNYVWAGMPICTYDIPASSYLVRRYELGLIAPRTQTGLNATIRRLCGELERFRMNVKTNRDLFAFEHFIGELESAYL